MQGLPVVQELAREAPLPRDPSEVDRSHAARRARVLQVVPAVPEPSTWWPLQRRCSCLGGLAWLLTGSRSAAEDVVQDAMTRVFGADDRVEFPSAYLRRAVVNTARSRHRDERRHRERERGHERSSASDRSDTELLALITELPYRQRVVIIARYWRGWSEQEIADALGCRPGTVKSLASRALARLRAEVEQ